jgi:hypothetical protein
VIFYLGACEENEWTRVFTNFPIFDSCLFSLNFGAKSDCVIFTKNRFFPYVKLS